VLIAEGMQVVVSCAFDVFVDFGMGRAVGFGCPVVFVDFQSIDRTPFSNNSARSAIH